MQGWEGNTDRFLRLMELSGCPFDDWDRDALHYGLAGTETAAGVYHNYAFFGPAPIQLRLAHAAPSRTSVTATAAPDTEAHLELTTGAEAWQRLCRAFQSAPRPEHFTRPYCPEGAGHHRLLQARNRDTRSHFHQELPTPAPRDGVRSRFRERE